MFLDPSHAAQQLHTIWACLTLWTRCAGSGPGRSSAAAALTNVLHPRRSHRFENTLIHSCYATPQHPGTATPIFVLRKIPTTLFELVPSHFHTPAPSRRCPRRNLSSTPSPPPLGGCQRSPQCAWHQRPQTLCSSTQSRSPSGRRGAASGSIPAVSAAYRPQHSMVLAGWHCVDASCIEGK